MSSLDRSPGESRRQASHNLTSLDAGKLRACSLLLLLAILLRGREEGDVYIGKQQPTEGLIVTQSVPTLAHPSEAPVPRWSVDSATGPPLGLLDLSDPWFPFL